MTGTPWCQQHAAITELVYNTAVSSHGDINGMTLLYKTDFYADYRYFFMNSR